MFYDTVWSNIEFTDSRSIGKLNNGSFIHARVKLNIGVCEYPVSTKKYKL